MQSTRLSDQFREMQLPFCQKKDHFTSQLNQVNMDERSDPEKLLEPLCCMCRLQIEKTNGLFKIMPVAKILYDLARSVEELKKPFNRQSIEVEVQFTNLSKDFTTLSKKCELISRDIDNSLLSFRSAYSRDVTREKLIQTLDSFNQNENEEHMKVCFRELKKYTQIEGDGLVINNSWNQLYQQDVRESADIYIHTMKQIIKRLYQILDEISQWSVLQFVDGLDNLQNDSIKIN